MPLSDRQLLDSLSRMSFIDTAELAGYPRRGPRNGPPSPDRPTSRRHRREGESRHRPTPFEPEIRPDGQWHRRRCRVPRIRDAFELRARLPCVQRVAGATHPPDGRCGCRLPSRLITPLRDRLPPVARGVPPQGSLRRYHHPPRRPVALRPAEGHSGVRLHARRLEATLVLPVAAPNRRTMRHCRHNDRDSYFHHMPKVNMRRRRRTRSALPNSLRAAARASCRHRTWSSLREAFRGSVSGGRVRRKSSSMATSNSHRRTVALARSTRLPRALTPVRSARHSTTSGTAGPKACSSSGCSSSVTTPASGSPPVLLSAVNTVRVSVAWLPALPLRSCHPSPQLFQLTGLGLHQSPQSPGFLLQLGYHLPQSLYLVRRAVIVNLHSAVVADARRVPELLQRPSHPPGDVPGVVQAIMVR